MMELADFKKMNQIRARVDSIVKDKRTAEALKPWYRQFCKRPTFNDEYLPTFNRPNVTLVDTEGRGVDRITEKGLVFDGVEYEVDCIIFATGFEVGTAYTRRAGFEVYGRGGKSLTEHWADGLKTLHGFYSAGFPNCFHMGITQNALDGELSAHARRAGAAHRRGHPAREVARGAMHRADAGGRSRVGRDDQGEGDEQPGFPRGVHARLLQQRRQAAKRLRASSASYTAAARSSSTS